MNDSVLREGVGDAARRRGSDGSEGGPQETVRGLIEATETFPTLEAAIGEARRDILLAYWTFDPDMRLSPETRRRDGNGDLETWGDLLRRKGEEGVVVRLLLSDFDPIVGHAFHQSSCRTYMSLCRIRDSLPAKRRAAIQPVLARHPAEVGPAIRIAIAPAIAWRLRGLCRKATRLLREEGRDAAIDWLACSPGLWEHVTVSGDAVRARPGRLTLRPGSFHEKSCIVDGRIAFVGGFDIDRKRYDTREHDAEDAWHDLACRVDGPVVDDLTARLTRRWNEESVAFAAFVDGLTPPDGVPRLPRPEPTRLPDAPDADDGRTDDGHTDDGRRLHLASTSSESPRYPFTVVPNVRDGGVLEAHLDLIGSAERLLYVETQFLRSAEIGRAIADRAAVCPELQVIVLLPLLPERMTESRDPDLPTRHGHWLQRRQVRRLRRALGDRFGVFTLVRREPAEPDLPPEVTAYGSDMIYVHAKLSIADDRAAVIGSANLNGRSLHLDTEASLLWRGDPEIRKFRERLWRRHLGQAADPGRQDWVAMWREAARANVETAPSERAGFVVPLPDSHLGHGARRSFLVPDRFV